MCFCCVFFKKKNALPAWIFGKNILKKCLPTCLTWKYQAGNRKHRYFFGPSRWDTHILAFFFRSHAKVRGRHANDLSASYTQKVCGGGASFFFLKSCKMHDFLCFPRTYAQECGRHAKVRAWHVKVRGWHEKVNGRPIGVNWHVNFGFLYDAGRSFVCRPRTFACDLKK